MALVVPDVGEVIMLQNITNKVAPEQMIMRLFVNNITPSESDVIGTFTEASGFGYAAITLLGATWDTPVSGDPSYIPYPKQAYTFTGALGDVYGYYMERATTGDLLYAERFLGAPYDIQNNGDKIEITPRIELS